MSVVSPTVTVTVEPEVHLLTIDVTPKTGKIGDVFNFFGTLTLNGAVVPNELIDLTLEGVGSVGDALTDGTGKYSVLWVADRAGTLTFHTAAPLAVSGPISLEIPFPEEIPYWWWIAAGGGALAIIVLGGVVVYQELMK